MNARLSFRATGHGYFAATDFQGGEAEVEVQSLGIVLRRYRGQLEDRLEVTDVDRDGRARA